MNETAVTFEMMPTLVDRLARQIENLTAKVDKMKSELEARHAPADGRNNGERLVFGIFKSGEVVRLHDKRLYDLPESPFKSYAAVFRVKQNGAPFRRQTSCGEWLVRIDDLEDWMLNRGMERELSNKKKNAPWTR